MIYISLLGTSHLTKLASVHHLLPMGNKILQLENKIQIWVFYLDIFVDHMRESGVKFIVNQ